MLQLRDISKQYKTGDLVQQALDRVSFNLRDNEFVSILGPSGSGKTTLLNIIGGLDQYDSGDLVINGVSTKNYKSKDWDTYRNHTIGFVFQSYNLIPHQSILSNVELALTISGMSIRERRKKAKVALENVGLGDQIHKRPNQMSGGQMQRVAIARALVNDPDILLADEPTGALDSETSVQIMDLLKKVAEKRLVVMVTHNAELAEEYSTRIINLKDGRIISDSNPFDGVASENAQEDVTKTPNDSKGTISAVQGGQKSDARKKKARMSFLTSLGLSANNLRSKKGRTILISLASSIGIIGIALILAISTGVNQYIINIQKDTMSSYPLTISAQTIDLNGIMNQSTSLREQMQSNMRGTPEDELLHVDYSNIEASQMVSTSFVKNNLTEFKKFLDNPDSGIAPYLGENGVVYTYDIAFDVFTNDKDGNLQNTDASVEEISNNSSRFSSMLSSGFSLMRSSMMNWQSGAYSSASNFSEMASGGQSQAVSQVIMDSYDLLDGAWPESYDEVVLILNRNNTLDAETLYQLGIMDGNTYQAEAEKLANGEETTDYTWSYEELLGKSFYLITASDHYQENEDGTYTYLEYSVINQDTLLKNAVELKVSGVIRQKADAAAAVSTAVGYTSALTEYVIKHTQESAVVKAQEATPKINVQNGLLFEAGTDEEKAQQAIAYIKTLDLTQKAQIYSMITYYENDSDLSEGMLTEDSDLQDLIDMFGLSDNSNVSSLANLMQMFGGEYLQSMMENVGALLTDESQQGALLDQWLENDPDQEILVSIYDQYLQNSTYADNMQAFGYVSLDAPTSINIYTDTFEDKDAVTEKINEYNESVDEDSKIVYTDYIALLTTSMTTIVNAISYVLIAFVAISLFVSCIMIGIITHISVLERTKEIGILRAMGASRRNISNVFNAETVIIGLISGLLGILITALLIIPINVILAVLLGDNMIVVTLPVQYALLLILISVVVTVIGGLIPAAKAAKKDPVIALRTE